ncbi:uncharacterized protein M421DRAFT_420733 [Didymella exigua CBS 183.55]|uniref:DUF4048 domain-containing protein n=1 Tax=Didymella exigua CBS 183.55 TaxID=1150837 RepID=A0A6A5RM60_9PLEO|nr:uncharacterized protein M421DRAFT_420733 [Didymella exigua CBS 183.55]KAF1928198.1 hypothetical protein M421DRAFT_420733 [Didymella exigua CBS 183.55]
MGSSKASPTLLKAYFSWVFYSTKICLQFAALAASLSAVCFELHPTTSALILLRLSRRLRLSSFVCMLTKEHDMNSSPSVQGAKAEDCPERDITRKRSTSKPPSQELASGAGQRLSRRESGDSSSTASSTTLSHPTPPPSMPSHARSKTTSHADLVRQGKRLSLQFPIQPTAGSSSPVFSPRSRPQSWIAAPSPLPSPEAQPPSPENNILAVLAAQERYVLELREELGKAEEDLKTLKKHYSLHEANKRRNDVRKVAQLQPLNTTLANIDAVQDDEDGGNLWMQREMERRKALLSNTKSSQRKVFSGSRHLRTLSLLSPDRAYAPSFPQSTEASLGESNIKRPTPPVRSSTSSDVSRQLIDVTSNDLGGLPNMQRDNILRTGKQLASDFSNGLFTFIEDIRQATVGDEAVNGAAESSGPSQNRDGSAKVIRNTSASRPSLSRSASSRKSVQKKQSIGEDFWSEHGLSEPKTTSVNKKTHTSKATRTPERQTARNSDSFEEDWDNWDSPGSTFVAKTTDTHIDSDESDTPASAINNSRTGAKQHNRRHDSKNSSLATISSASMPDTSTSRDPKRNSIPWPDLVNLSPSNLKRTASHLMKEWEKQLTPPPESRLSSHSQGDYIGRSGSPGSLI